MKNIPHESGKYHVTGEAVYVDDIAVSDDLLIGRVYYSPVAHAKIRSFDLTKAQNLKGVHAVLSYKDIPGHNQVGPVFHDEPLLAEDLVECVGQGIFIIAAESEEIAREAEKLIEIEFEELKPILTIEDAMHHGELIQPQRKIECGNIDKAFKEADYLLEDTLHIGGQEHWYLETQTCLCVPGEGDEITAYSSTQNPSETQALIAEVLGVNSMDVDVVMRRMGGGFGGKETQANHPACWSAILAKKTGCPVKIRLFRDDDQKITGKRHPFLMKFKVGYMKDGTITAIDVEQNCNCGWASDLSMSILERTQMHADNAYYVPNMRIIGNGWKTNLPSNTAYRGFGGPQGMAVIEAIIDRIARHLQKDTADIRYKNFYGIDDRNLTPYGQKVENNRLYMLWDNLIESSDYRNRRQSVNKFNSASEFRKRGLALTPIKFGISFTTSFLNQAGALVNIYKDGSVTVNHGGTEMGQGLHTKIQQITALEFGIDISKIKVTATNTSKVPNTSPTAASSGTDMNGMAVKNAAEKLKIRIASVVCDEFNKKEKKSLEDNIVFEDGFVVDKNDTKRRISFEDAIQLAYFNRTSLSATGFYRTPGVHFDRDKGTGHPFFYFAFGMAVAEVEIDVLTGRHTFIRADVLHDCGNSINENIDIGQIEGAYIQGVGWCTSEECKYDDKGNLLNHSPDTYKIPGIQDIPDIFNVNLLKGAPNPNTIRRSKAVGEPPFMLAFSAWLAIKDAISAISDHKIEPDFSIPMTNEKILLSIEKLKQ